MSKDQNILDAIPPKTKGKKLLMTLKTAQNIYNNYANSTIEDYYSFMEQNDDFIEEYKSIIKNEEKELNQNKSNQKEIDKQSKEMITDIDIMLKEIGELKDRINDFKIRNKIKTKRDYLKYMNLIDNNNINNNMHIMHMNKSQNKFFNKLEKSFKKNDEEEKYNEYKKYLIPKESQKEKDYLDIKAKLKKQQELIKQFEEKDNAIKVKENNDINKANNINDINEADIWNNKCTGDEDVDKLLNEIKLADMKMDSYLKDIDECIEMNENIEKQLDTEEETNITNNPTEENLNNQI